MAYFILRGYDLPEPSVQIRAAFRPEHCTYILEEHHGVRAVVGGMVVTDNDDEATGALLVLDAPDRDSAIRYLKGDPYHGSGLFARIEVDR